MPHAHAGAVLAPVPVLAPGATTPRAPFLRRRVQVVVMAALLAVSLVPVQPPQAAEAASTEAARVIAHARSHLGDRYRSGGTGPSSFDCSGFVYHTFSATGLLSRIGGRRSSAGYYLYFRSLGRASRYNPRVGDLVVYGWSGRVSHVGIYVGNGYTISALTSGIRIHATKAVTKPFIAYLHVRLSR